MTTGRFAAIAVAAIAIAFGAAFGIGKATAGGDEKGQAPSDVTPVEVAGAPDVASFSPSGSLPAQKREAPTDIAVGGGGGTAPAPSAPVAPAPTAPAPSAPAPSAPAPSAPAPSAPAPSAPAPGGSSGGGSSGGGSSGGGG